jgi:outer membrane protein OmpA-like peptidoglycan-associated protein
MKKSNGQADLNEDAAPNTLTDEEGMAALRGLLLGPAEAQLADVRARLTDPKRQLREVCNVLPAAIAVRSRQDDELSDALAPTVTAAVERSVRKDPQPLADAIFPVIGPAIRKAIASALSGMVQSFNQSLTYSMSVKGLRWRLEALRTGKSFGEVVLLHTLLFRVEQVFLIHKETGLLLHQVSIAGAPVQDADMISAMLTAIQDFAHDSFTTDRGEELETFQVGELTVLVEGGPLAVLAGVIRGTAPQDLRAVFQETLERIHLQFGAALGEFSGDAKAFAAAAPLLEDCLEARYDAPAPSEGTKGLKLTPFTGAVGIILLALLFFGAWWLRDKWRWDSFIERLRNEPGIVVTENGRRGGKYFLSGLRDPLARDPQAILRESKIDPGTIESHWESFQALTPAFVSARAKTLLEPPATVRLSVHDGVLEAEGFASHQWVLDTRRAARLLPGVSQYRDDRLLDLNRIEDPLLMFELDRAVLVRGQEEKLNLLVADIGRLQAQALALKKNVLLEISGHTDGSGTEARNSTLSEERAKAVAGFLNTRLPGQTNVTIRPVGSKKKLREEVTETDRATNRSVTFRVIATDTQ